MKIIWQIKPQDVERVRAFVDSHRNDPFVRQRIASNLSETKLTPSRDDFWYMMVSCLLTTQQRSGPDSAVTRFINSVPFPLSYQLCVSQDDLRSFARDVIGGFGGLRFSNRLSDHIATNLHRLEQGLWNETVSILEELRLAQTVQSEREAAGFVSAHFKGFGPKQSRNLLQGLGLTRYEIPIDSRITKWLNDFGFPVRLSATALSDPNYYNFVSDGIQQLCAQSGVYPCVLDAVIFTSFDRGGWSEEHIVW
jgi:hypothetical protein